MQLDPTIFRAYDIRGIVPSQLMADTAEQVGRAFAAYLQPKTVVVGRDGRLTGPEFHARVLKGLTRSGVDVLDIGQVSTDAFYYACASRDLPGIMVTASHNPAEYNGFKTVRRMPELLLATELKEPVMERTYKDAATTGTVKRVHIISEFLDHLLSIVPATDIKPLKVAIDTSNGMQGPIWEELAKRLPITVVPLCFEPDGSFPNHGNDIVQPENQKLLRAAVKREQADLGLIFDPDGDRCLLVDDRGETVPGDFVTALLAVSMLERSPGSTII
ncbi:MAG TPA: phosphomannomutase/phosphoglucomutase, partial [Candidatus Saccharimonadales bacterium]|nr:phosphomannomutase/phosphoglucomutase [Candidatus Saccharimonadales bacterium]